MIIPLCEKHHDPRQMSLSNLDEPSVHGNHKLFVALVGPQAWCVFEVHKRLNTQPSWVSDQDWCAYNGLNGKDQEISWLIDNKSLRNIR